MAAVGRIAEIPSSEKPESRVTIPGITVSGVAVSRVTISGITIHRVIADGVSPTVGVDPQESRKIPIIFVARPHNNDVVIAVDNDVTIVGPLATSVQRSDTTRTRAALSLNSLTCTR
jgi:hypothetical protein